MNVITIDPGIEKSIQATLTQFMASLYHLALHLEYILAWTAHWLRCRGGGEARLTMTDV